VAAGVVAARVVLTRVAFGSATTAAVSMDASAVLRFGMKVF